MKAETLSPAGIAFGLAALVLIVALPWWLPHLVADYWVDIFAEILIWSLLAASVNLLYGYTGLLSFGQALYFGIGAYGVAFGLQHFGLGFWPSFFLGIFASTALSAVAGIFAVRLSWHYFSIITIVFGLIFYLLAVGAKDLTGGDDGLSLSLPPFFKSGNVELTLFDQATQYLFIFSIVALCYLGLWMLLRSPLGYALKAVRENAARAGLIGLDSYWLRYTSFVIAGFLAGTAGTLFALFSRYASAQYMYWTVSGEGVIWTIVGGAGTLFGPLVGTAVLIVLREEISSVWEHYLLVLGVIVILMVTFAPRGIIGVLSDLAQRFRRRPRTPAVVPSATRPSTPAAAHSE